MPSSSGGTKSPANFVINLPPEPEPLTDFNTGPSLSITVEPAARINCGSRHRNKCVNKPRHKRIGRNA
ncbi:hypothetical protein PBY51_005854 [Eleginops maclovinus]|uniref:Uncharacterized protein n=1 Tax=Eleginops maclovinus TaxID=56733 RepID=A0AAN7WQA4_ELEMC|nr:hypothetical protein PBY51_005854 [Eleginops maclovinus]